MNWLGEGNPIDGVMNRDESARAQVPSDEITGGKLSWNELKSKNTHEEADLTSMEGIGFI